MLVCEFRLVQFSEELGDRPFLVVVNILDNRSELALIEPETVPSGTTVELNRVVRSHSNDIELVTTARAVSSQRSAVPPVSLARL